MNRILKTPILLWLLGLGALAMPSSSWAQANCTPENQLEKFLKKKCYCDGRHVLAYDHRETLWRSYVANDDCSLSEIPKSRIEKDVNGAPLLFLKQSEPLLVTVVDTNPLVYGVTRNPATLEDVEELANLKKLASLLGSVVSAAVSPPVAFPIAAAAPEEAVEIEFVAPPPAEKPTPVPDEVKDLTTMAKKKNSQVMHLLSALSKAAEAVQQTLAVLDSLTGQSLGFLQAVELGASPPDFPDPNIISKILTKTEGDFDALQSARDKAREEQLTCRARMKDLADLLVIRLGPNPVTPVEIAAFKKNVDSSLGNLRTDKLTEDSCSPDAIDLILPIVDWLKLTENLPGPDRRELSESEVGLLKPLATNLLTYVGLAKNRDTAVTEATKALGDRGKVSKSAAQLQQLAARKSKLDEKSSGKDNCRYAHGVLEIPLPSQDNDSTLDFEKGKVLVESFKVTADSPYKDRLALDHKDGAETKFKVRRPRFFDLGVDFGVTYTDLVEPKWEAVAEDCGEDECDKFIQRVSENSRAGETALFASFTPWQRAQSDRKFRLGFQVGAGLDTDQPEAFVGLVVALGKYFRLGAGYTWQEVLELAPGQIEGVTKVESTEAIRTRDHFERDTYLSLTISIDKLPFFAPSD